MPIPQNKTQTILSWAATIALSIFLAFLASLAKQLPGTDPINWRAVLLDVITAVIAIGTPLVTAGFIFPRFGEEHRAELINKIGHEKSERILEQVANNQQAVPVSAYTVDYERLADEIMKIKAQEDAEQQIRRQASARSSTTTTT